MSVHADPPPAVVREPKGLSYLTGSQLGKGGFAICYSAEACENGKKTGKIVALKIVRSEMEPPKLAQKFVTELQLHSKLRHSNIVEFYRAFSFGENTYVVLEICTNGSLADALRKRKFFTMPEIRRFVIQTCGAVKYLHHRNIIHRDLKTGNLFLDHNMNIKVGDFGLAAMLVGQNDIGARRTTMCGTPNYLAPEILEKTGKGHNEKVDLWAIGIIAYTLAVGKAPFHAAKREEIYKKLQNREYSWPEVSKFPSDISDDLKDLVSSLLVDEDDRPSPDHIVSHAFFKMAFIPEALTSSVLSEKPKWSIAPPTAETIQRGFSESWYRICKASGVGEYAPGRMFPLAGGKRIPSVIKDVEREIREGNVPVVPMPADVIYLPFPEMNNLLQQKSRHLNDIVEERELPSNGGLMETTGNGRLNRPRSKVDVESARLKENARPEESRTVEPVTKAGTTIKRVASRRVRQDDEVAATAPPAVDRFTRHPVVSATSTMTEARPATIPEPVRELARNPTRRARPTRVDSGNTKVELTKELPKTRITLSRSNTDTELPKRSRTIPRTVSPVEIPELRTQKSSRSLPLRTKTPPTASTEPLQSSHLPRTSPEQVLERALQLRDNLVLALRTRTSSSRRNTPEPCDLPFITKWVDYSRKLGIGYVLSNGNIGCILNATTKNPLTYVIVRNGLRALKELQADPSADIPLNLYEADNEGLKLTEAESSRRKMIGQVWTKFARYMCQQLGDAEDSNVSRGDPTPEMVSPFVRFYERIDGVGIWGFSNGCFQLNFTDHTKLVLSANGKLVSFTCLPLVATERLNAGDMVDMPYKYIKGRVVLEAPVTDLLHVSASLSRDAQIAQANLLREKLSFFVNVVGKWRLEGGIGCSIESVADLQWQGPRLEEGKSSKVDWVSIGSIRV